MKRENIRERRDWRTTAETHGFTFHTPGGEVYWDETVCYRFTLRQIEDHLEDRAAEIEQMCFEIVESATRDEAILARLQIPAVHWGLVADSWRRREKNLYGRLDFAYDGKGPAKLYEYNADTPTSLFESSVFQWVWLEEARARGIVPKHCDQFNSLHERLIAALGEMGLGRRLHLAAVKGHAEDQGTIAYLADCAEQAGLRTKRMFIEDIGVADDGRFTDLDDQPIEALFKLYPWEWLLREPFAERIAGSGCRFIEPAWKSILSNKGLAALLWHRFPGHPNLLETYFEGDANAARLPSRHVRKPLYSREGANVELRDAGRPVAGSSKPGPYGAEGHVLQAYHPLPEFAGKRPVCGVWLVASQPAGLGLREDDGLITTNGARFVPHVIDG